MYIIYTYNIYIYMLYIYIVYIRIHMLSMLSMMRTGRIA